MIRFLIIFLLISSFCTSQDKLFFTNGSTQKGYIVSKAKDFIYFKKTDTSTVQKINKSDLVLIEDYKGNRHYFSSSQKKEIDSEQFQNQIDPRRNSFGIQPCALLVGRATVAYERLTEDHKIGFVIPFSLTFDPTGTLQDLGIDTTQNSLEKIKGVNFIAGLDVNFYVGRSERATFFLGPRLRYGTDLYLRNVEGFTMQTQFGWRFGRPEKKFVQHLSIGVGFVRILSSPAGQLIDPKQSYPWCSLNYRLGIKW